jgi:hypothetical protein
VRSPRSDKRGAGRSRRDTAGLTHKACRQRPSIVLCGEHAVAHLLQVVIGGVAGSELGGVRGLDGLNGKLRRVRLSAVLFQHPAIDVAQITPT